MRKNKIRILHVAQAAGGVDRYIRMLLKYLDKEKFENILVCSQDFREEDYRGLVDSFEQIEMTRAIGASDLKAIKAVRKLIRKYNPDIVYGSKDQSGRICDQYANLDSRIKVIHKQNGGLSAARNTGYNHSKYEWLMFVDGDDYVDNNFCYAMLNAAIQYDVDLVMCGMYKDYGKTREKYTYYIPANVKFEKKDCIWLQEQLLHFNGNIATAYCKLINKKVLSTYTGKFDFSAVDSLSDELKNSDSYKQEAADVVNLCCEALVKLHQKCCISIRFVMQTIHNLQRFADIVPSIRGLDRHYDAFFPVDNADCSFLTDFDSIAEGLEAAKNDSDNYLAMVGSNSPLSRLAALKGILKSEDYVAAVSNLLFADQEVAPYAGMKKMILCLSMEETDEATALLLDTYCTVIMNYLRLSTAKEKVGKDNPFISASTEQILPIDLLIAQSIKSSKSGSPQEVDTNLDEFLEYYPLICTSSWEDQLFILQKVFAYLKMYSQERKVLEFFVKKETKKPDLCHLSKGGMLSLPLKNKKDTREISRIFIQQ